ncbi:DeoR/GlpR family DNA-binding transcription regulator [Viridibacillus arvi]|uniref:DeoR/GlpR family DNA-binding transcription regulator n=1 Tax=Viridibacillus arvi TaxID=263475 RepID=UPI00187B6FE6|nr:DeoR/GlpR family DNA-binding transcription regulator [Viridibacillus sp. JNUCC-6]QOV13348.1 DeoR/GlpR transcriptional regulator [Viridibacillus sp. JNUCC-6]
MITAERHHIILDLLSRNGVVDLQNLVQRTKSSDSTIRRDLALLEEQGLLKRIHGGATLPYSKIDEPNIQEKSSKNLHEKQLIAEAAASMIRDGDCIYLDAGTTISEMIPFLINKKIAVVTNGLMHVDALTSANITTYVIGGRIKANTKAIVGSVAQENLKQYRFDKCFLGMNGIDIKFGFSTPDPEEAVLKKLAIELAEESFVLADKSKFKETFFAKVAEIENAGIITTNLDNEAMKKFAEKTNMKVVTS